MTQPDDTTMAAWTALIRTSERALDRIAAALKAAGLPPLDWYDMLWEIEKAGPEGLRPKSLKSRLLMRQYAVSRLLARMAREGYVDQIPCAADKRGHSVAITQAGRATRKAMWPVYAAEIQSMIGESLSDEDRMTLTGLLNRAAPAPRDPTES